MKFHLNAVSLQDIPNVSERSRVEKSFLNALREGYRPWLARGRRLLLAVSGGGDSTALLLATERLISSERLHVEVGWVDHGVRLEAPSEGALVAAHCARLGILFHARQVELDGDDGNFEAKARTVRYAALEEVRATQRLDWLVTAHTADDQAETVLMRLARGSALRGATGIARQRQCILRPMLSLTRKSGHAFLDSMGEVAVDDRMNFDERFLRVRLRTHVLPALERAAGPSSARHLAEFAELARADEEFLQDLARNAAERIELPDGTWDATGLQGVATPLRRRLWVNLFESRGISPSAASIQRAETLLRGRGKTDAGGGWTLNVNGGRVRLVRDLPQTERESPMLPVMLRRGENVDFGGWTLEWSAKPRPLRENTVAFQLPRAPRLPHVVVRGPKPGDRVGGGTVLRRRVQDLLVDEKIVQELRRHWPLVCTPDGKVLWVVGLSPKLGAGVGSEMLFAIRGARPTSTPRVTSL